ncbi:ankyrin repeat domain-containing protein [Uliginosibacterium sp. H3]|uniref:Ankyrin repeat domain-containing protein n=1 Tax=Uliginosibacterium silvisoli TaxID=3114758 RepID=A0ABU6K394_9RHOO|nr:ankyrin repeat domain-containing protein [Uliginosibacterium sp. H3]
MKKGSAAGLRLCRMLAGIAMCVMAGCVPSKLLKYSAFHEREFAPRSKPAEIQQRSTAEVLAGGYLLIGYIDLRRNVRTCYVDGSCTNHADKAPADTDLQQEAAQKGGDVVTILEERAIVEKNDKSICTSFYSTTTMVNGTPVTTTYCSSYRIVPGKLEALISRALVWRLEPAMAGSDANARAIETALKVLEAAQLADEQPGARALISSKNLVRETPLPVVQVPDMDNEALDRTIQRAVEQNDRGVLAALAKDGRLNVWKDEKGHSALMLALLRRKPDAVRTLLPLEQDRMRRDTEGLNVLDYAVATGDLPLVKDVVAAGHDVRGHNGYGQSPLFFATLNEHKEVFEWLLGQGLRASETDARDATVLMFAAESGQLALVQRIVRMAIDIDAKERDGRNALMVAARGSRPEAVKVLLAAMIDTQAVDKRGFSALHYAAAVGDLESARLLLKGGVWIDTVSKDGTTAILLAILQEKWAFAEFLATKEASVEAPAFTAADVATTLVSRKQLTLLKYWLGQSPGLAASFKGNPDWLVHAAKSSNADIVKYMVADGAPLNRAGSNGVTPLMAAAQAGNEEAVRALLELKADPRLRDGRKQTALQMAEQNGHEQVVALMGRFGVRQ